MLSKTICPDCKGHLKLHSDIIFYSNFLFGDCSDCSYLGVWSEGDWQDTTPYQEYFKTDDYYLPINL